MCSLSSPQIINVTILHGRIFGTVERMFIALLISKPSKNSASLTVLLSRNFKGLIYDFYLNRKTKVLVGGVQTAYSGQQTVDYKIRSLLLTVGRKS